MLLNRRYRLQEQLGEGGAGVIYKAEDEQLHRTVAIKLLLPGQGSMTGEKLARFQSEARSVARLNHPNIITLYDYEEVDGQPYLVIEYVPGVDLWELDNQYAPNIMPFGDSLPIIDGILSALSYSHQHQVIHRDLKPENVMITPDKQVKVMDFGLARIEGQSRLTQNGLVAGTAAYLAPELALGEAGDHRVDLYAVGVILYELTTGRRPFSGDDPLTVISQHIHAPVVPPQHYNPDIPLALQNLNLRLLAKTPDQRYLSADDVRRDLAPVLKRLKTRTETITQTGLAPRRTGAITDAQSLLERIVRGKMIGRAHELEQLKEQWDHVSLGEPGAKHLVLVSGEAGIGKTRLLRELRVYASLREGNVLYSEAREQDSGAPYALIATLLRNYVREQSAKILRGQLSGFIAGEIVKLAPQLTEKLGSIQPNPPLEPAAERARMLEQITNFILAVGHTRPTLLLLDDLNFADPGSLEILETLLKHAAGTSILIAGAYRDVALSYNHPVSRFINARSASGTVSAITLRRLPQPAVKEMLEALLGNSVSRKFVRSIYDATEGNPLFVEEVIKSLVVDGQIQLKDGRWEQRNTSLLHVPGSIKAVLGKRLDHIKPQTLDMLRLAAVIGRRFGLDLLLAASPYDDDVIQWTIEEALRAELIEVVKVVDQPLPHTAETDIVVYYQFQHALIRETLYEELRPLRRRRLHRRVAEAMQQLAQSRPQINAAILAQHLIDAALDEQAVPSLTQAGQRAAQVYANQEAVDYFSQALEILEDLAPDLSGEAQRDNLVERFEVLNQQRNVCDRLSDRDREFASLQAMLHLADTLADKGRWVEVMAHLSTHYWHLGRLDEAEEAARQALEMAQQDNNLAGQLAALERIARVLWTRRDAHSMEYATQALALAQILGDRANEGRLTGLVGQLFVDPLREPERAHTSFVQALKICRETNNTYEEAWTLWGMGKRAMLVNDYTTALKEFTRARTIAKEIGASLQIAWDLYHAGIAWYHLGELDRSLKSFQQAQPIFNTTKHPRGEIYLQCSLALTLIARGQLDEAAVLIEQAVKQAEARHDLRLMLRSYETQAHYYQHLGGEEKLTSSVRLSNRVIKTGGEIGDPDHALTGYHLRGLGFFKLRHLSEAFGSSQQAINRLEQIVYLDSPQVSVPEVYFAHSRIATALGQVDTARHYLQKAWTEVNRTANLIQDEQTRAMFMREGSINQKIVTAWQANG
jgi:tetratricopeptide (TPR) repeat protein